MSNKSPSGLTVDETVNWWKGNEPNEGVFSKDDIIRNGRDDIAFLGAEIERLRTENEHLRDLSNRQAVEISNLVELDDVKEVLRTIGKFHGCDHVESADERRQLVNCAEQQWDALKSEVERLREALRRVANYDKEPLWMDDRDDSAWDILSIAREALGEKA